MAHSVIATPFPAATFPGAPQVDVEWAPPSVPGDAPSWRSMVSHPDGIRGFTISTGRQQWLDEFVPSTATVTFENWSDQYDPDNSLSPVYGMVLEDRQIRIVFRDVNGATYYPFQGYIDGWPLESTWPNDKTFTLSASSGERLAAQSSLPASMFEFALRQIGLPDHWWPMDDSADSTVVLDHGTLTPAIGLPRNVTLGNAGILTFDGGRNSTGFLAGDVLIPSTALPQSTNAWSIGLFFNAQAVGSDYFSICTLGGVNGLVQQELDIWIEAGVTAGRLLIGYDAVSFDGSAFWNSGATRYDDTFTHMVFVTLSADHKIRIYVDGVLKQTSNDLTGNLAAFGTGTGSIGSYWNAGLGTTNAWFFDGAATHLMMWDNFALSDQNVADLWSAAVAGLAGEDTGARVNRVLDVIGWSKAQRQVQTGSSLLGGFDLQATTGNDYLRSLAATEVARNYADGQGNYVWQSRSDMVANTRALVSQATFTDQAGFDPGGGYQYARLKFERADQYIINRAEITRQGGPTQIATDAVSLRDHRERSYTNTVLSASDVDTLATAQWVVAKRATSKSRITALEFEPFGDTSMTTTLLGLKLGDRITVVRRTSSGQSLSTDFSIEGISDTFQQSGGAWSWVRSLKVWQADVGTFGIWGTSLWDQALWVF